jgi:aryl carrier-like protein
MTMTTEPDIQKIYDVFKEILVQENKIGPGVDFVRIVSLSNNKRD